EGCRKQPFLGEKGMTTGENCTQHAPDGMVNTKGKLCGTEGCGKFAAFGVAGTKTAEYCIQH
ncbi:unnamed protein product, partial [Ascophyllum nodosum]